MTFIINGVCSRWSPSLEGQGGGRGEPGEPWLGSGFTERGRTALIGCVGAYGAGIRAHPVVVTTMRQSRITAARLDCRERLTRSQWHQRVLWAGGNAQQPETTENNIGKPRTPCSHMRAYLCCLNSADFLFEPDRPERLSAEEKQPMDPGAAAKPGR